MMDDEATMAMNEELRDEGLSSEANAAQRQAYAAKIMAAEQSYRSSAGQLIGSPYVRPDGEVRAACLDAATRIGADASEVVEYARAFYAFLTEKPAS